MHILKYYKSSPIIKNIIANIFKIFILFVNQILLIPLYLKFWGVEMYADWIVMTAISGFFTMTDGGLNNATNNRFCIKYAQKDYTECKSLIINNFLIVSIIFLLTIIILTISTYYFNIKSILAIHTFTHNEVNTLSIILVTQIFMQMYSTILNSIYNANHLASKATYLDNLARLGNAISILVGIIFSLNIVYIALLGIAPYTICLIFKIINSKQIFRIPFSINDFDMKLLKQIALPSLSYLSFPIGNALIFQCYTVIINLYLGSEVLVSFNTTRTMANFVRSFVQAIAHAIKPEFSISYGLNDTKRLTLLLKKCILLCVTLSIIASIVVEIGGEPIYSAWTAGKISFDRLLVSIFLATTIINSLWESSSIAMTATNNYTKLGLVYLASCAISCTIAYIFGSSNLSIYYIASSILVSDMIMSTYSLYYSQRLIAKSI